MREHASKTADASQQAQAQPDKLDPKTAKKLSRLSRTARHDASSLRALLAHPHREEGKEDALEKIANYRDEHDTPEDAIELDLSLLPAVLGGIGGAFLGGVGGLLAGGALQAGAGVLGGGVLGAAITDQTLATRRSLNDAEKQYLKEIYHDSLDVDVIEVTFDDLISAIASKTTGNVIHLNPDYSTGIFDQGHEDELLLNDVGLGLLAHEAAHCWQFQHGGTAYIGESLWHQSVEGRGHDHSAYEWVDEFNKNIPWEQWNPEAQARFIEDYNGHYRRAAAGRDPYATEFLKKYEPIIAQVRAGKGAASESLAGWLGWGGIGGALGGTLGFAFGGPAGGVVGSVLGGMVGGAVGEGVGGERGEKVGDIPAGELLP